MGKRKLDFSELNNLDFSELNNPKPPAPATPPPPVPVATPPEEPSFDDFSMLRDQAASAPTTPETSDKHTSFDAFNRAVGQGGTYGFGDELSAAIDYGVSKLPGVRNVVQAVRTNLPGAVDPSIPITDPTASYSQRRDAYRTANKEASQEHPGVYAAGEIAGALAAPGPKVGRTLAKTVLHGAAVGAASGLGHSDADTAGGVVTDTAEGAGLGAGTAAAGKALGTGLGKLAKAGITKIADKLGLSEEATDLIVGNKEIRDIVRSKDAVAQLEKMKTKLGKQIADHMINLDQPGTFHASPIVADLENKITELRAVPSDANLAKIDKIRSVIDKVKTHFDETDPEKRASLRQLITSVTKDDKEAGKIVNNSLRSQATQKYKDVTIQSNPAPANDNQSISSRKLPIAKDKAPLAKVASNDINNSLNRIEANNNTINQLQELQDKIQAKRAAPSGIKNVLSHPGTQIAGTSLGTNILSHGIEHLQQHGVSGLVPGPESLVHGAIPTAVGAGLYAGAKGLARLVQAAKDGNKAAQAILNNLKAAAPNATVGVRKVLGSTNNNE